MKVRVRKKKVDEMDILVNENRKVIEGKLANDGLTIDEIKTLTMATSVLAKRDLDMKNARKDRRIRVIETGIKLFMFAGTVVVGYALEGVFGNTRSKTLTRVIGNIIPRT